MGNKLTSRRFVESEASHARSGRSTRTLMTVRRLRVFHKTHLISNQFLFPRTVAITVSGEMETQKLSFSNPFGS